MERLTTNKDVSEMSVIELAYNSCYAKDKKARYRDYEMDVDARELAIKMLAEHADIPNEFTCDEDFDEFMLDSLQYGTDDMLGLIAVFYRNLWSMTDLRERLKYYEDLEEQGKLLKLPCKVGDTLYTVNRGEIISMVVCEISVFSLISDDVQIKCTESSSYGFLHYSAKNIGDIVFLSRDEAETALKRVEDHCIKTEG